MKKQQILAVALMLTAVVYGQKRELKKAEKSLEALNYSEALAYLNDAEVFYNAMDKSQVVQFYLIKTEAHLGSGQDVEDNNLNMALEALNQAKSRGLDKESQERVNRIVGTLRGVMVNKAIAAQNSENYTRASDLLTQGYALSPTDTSFLYYAAGNLVNGGFFDQALEKYTQLLEMRYTGVREEFYAVSKDTGEEILFGSKDERDTAVRFVDNCKSSEYVEDNSEKKASDPAKYGRIPTLVCSNYGSNEGCGEVIEW